ncbi:cytochrome B [Rhizobium sp. Root274]|uniref:cytochrome c oxidase subunit I n=1 Tax=unclassified Rhizobium TaxID=2613769 RepID=UPI000713FB4E|nr:MULTISPECIES: cytochrome c oxidase subunit I [unclassified Rhizobium]KQW27195.1 cytochrome B [Rhizobium sp. Root1240]KRD26671.1 cytochrome B [Rhizobium sp. Root274]
MSETRYETRAAAASSPIQLHHQLDAVWESGSGLKRFSAVNHNVIGRRFMVTALVFFAIGGVLAMLIRTQLASSNSAFLDAEQYAQVFTMHGVIMMFLFAIPFFEGLAIYLLPKMLGARDLAFPRMSAYGYWCYLFGGSFLIAALVFGIAPDGGWFMYTPLSSKPYSPGINADVWLLGITFVEISALSAAIELMVTILRLRAPGMSLTRMPIFAWYMLVVAAMMLIGFPPLILGSILLEVERAFDLPFFDPTRGGDPLLWQHLFWLFGHPEVYIIFLPAAGALSTIIPVLSRRTLEGYNLIVAAIVAMAFLSFGLWVHHMYTVGIPHVALSFFSAASALVAIPTGIQIFAWLATLAHGRPRLSIPMLHVFGFFFVFVLGGLTGVMLAMVPFDWQAHDSHFVVAHLHYVLVGGFVFPMMAAAYYWLPHITGRQPVQHLSKPAFWLVFIGFNTTFFAMHLTGLRGMPRRVFEYPQESGWEVLNFVSSMGSFVMTIGFALVALDLILLIRFGRPYRRDPWQAGTLEWATPTPPPSYTFGSLPRIEQRADGLEPQTLGPHLAAGRGYLGFMRNGWMETLAVDMVTGEVDHVVVLPRPTYLPFWTAVATALFFASLLAKLYWLTPIAVVFVVGLFFRWTPSTGLKQDIPQLDVGLGSSAPHHQQAAQPPSWWGVVFALAANATLYTSLLFGTFFLWLSAPNWPPPDMDFTFTGRSAFAAAGLLVTAVGARIATGQAGGTPLGLAFTLGGYLMALAAMATILLAIPAPQAHAASASAFAVAVYVGLHVIIGGLLAGYGLWRWYAGYISESRSLDLRIGRLWHDYTAIAGLIGLAFPFALQSLSQVGGNG